MNHGREYRSTFEDRGRRLIAMRDLRSHSAAATALCSGAFVLDLELPEESFRVSVVRRAFS